MAHRPLLMLDVDGPIAPFDRILRPRGYRTHRVPSQTWRQRQLEKGVPDPKPLRVWLNPAHGTSLLALPYDLVWATAWRHEADEHLAPLLGLPKLPYVNWESMNHKDPDGLHWKTRQLVYWADQQPFAWVDDEIGPQDTEWIAANHPGRALTLKIDRRYGLRPDHFAQLADWAQEIAR
ncbi:hypothetical protein [Kitasatospora sp. NPDC088783]|uniref:hypothetical protein n=1 Tax=Kitasatospora sp. NPDC088783 TaxID=3364077 RepID=UPI00380747D8